ncbi:MAG: hypothetical protein BJ554DRAFT_4309 [Olpidium bornovanus]|uniref:Uncharacterized protein n=1 Tax=Olpidium bornovanus TaxID=278681 RepID=A0A8H7ZMF4_9FUNG|nr:MAG: hypothetical protein BJ554DRAFT_4309 [Olpidium bornovanus]
MSAQQSTRPLVFKRGGVEVTILVPLPLYPVAERLRELFSAECPSEAEPEQATTELEVTGKVLALACERAAQGTLEGGDGFDFLPVVSVVVQHLESRYLRGNDVHAAVAGVPASARNEVLRAYYLALAALGRRGLLTSGPLRAERPPRIASALFGAARAGRVRLIAVFGGQGNVEEYVEELAALVRTYEGVVEPFVRRAALTLAHHSALPEARDEHAARIDLAAWLEKPEARPAAERLLSAHISLPLIGVTQLACYYVAFKVLGVDPAAMAQFFAAGATGHSQGLVSAVAIASSRTEEDFFANAQKAIALL